MSFEPVIVTKKQPHFKGKNFLKVADRRNPSMREHILPIPFKSGDVENSNFIMLTYKKSWFFPTF